MEWDAFRREDGRWTLTALYEVAGRAGTATFSHDPRGNFVTVDDDDARWLVGDTAPAAAPAESAADDLAAARQRRLNAVSGEDDALGADAIEMLMAGAWAVGVGSALYARGLDAMQQIRDEMTLWLQAHGVASLEAVRGMAHR